MNALCDRRSISCATNTRSRSKTCTPGNREDVGPSPQKQKHSTPYFTPPVYSEYPADITSLYNFFPDVSAIEGDANRSRTNSQVPNSSCCSAAAYYDQMNELSAKHAKEAFEKANKTTRERERSQSRPRLGHCKLEGDDDDPMGLGHALMDQMRETFPDKEMSIIYPLINMASNTKFLFDGVNMIRLVPKSSLWSMFATNPTLFQRVKQFVRHAARREARQPRATPGLNEPHREIAEAALHQRIRVHH